MGRIDLHEVGGVLDMLYAEKAARRLREFIPLAWEVLEPGTPYIGNWHIDAMCEHLEAVSRRDIKRLVINVPPGTGKSRCVTTMFPCWEWIHHPHMRFMFWSYAQKLSTKHSIERRMILQSDWYRRHWNHFELTKDDNQKTQFTNDHRGHMIATSRDGTATGDGGECLIIDDPLNPKQAASEKELENAEDWFKMTVPSRLRDKRNGAIIIVMQRLHEKDTTALALDLGYEHLMIPAEYDPRRSKVTCLGWKDPRTEEGEPMWPEREGPKELDFMKRSLGPYAWSGQFQQNPHPDGGGIFKREWFKYYRFDDLARLGHGIRFGSVDLACSEREQADYTVICSWMLNNGKLYLLDLVRGRMAGPDIVPAIRQACHRNHLGRVYVEKVAFQLSLIQQAQREGLPVEETTPKGDKVARAYGAAPAFARGDVMFPSDAYWLSSLEGELLGFPNSVHKDMVDAIVYGVLECPWNIRNATFTKRSKPSIPSYGLQRPPGW